MIQRFQMLINGEWVDSSSGETLPVTNPATLDAIANIPKATPADAERALQAADGAFKEWSGMTTGKRTAILRKAAALARERRESLACWLTSEQGKPLAEARGEITAAADALDYFAQAAGHVLGEIYPTEAALRRSLVIRQPVGVVVAIGPWNYPVSLLSWKVGPALAAGCTVVAKPPSVTPVAAIEFLRCLVDAGAPAGVINIVTGPGSVVGPALITNPICRKVSLTGQTETGREIMHLAARNIARMSLELGGHCPMMVDQDADLATAVKGGVYRAFRNMGQICNAINRIYVHETVYQEFVDEFVKRTRALKIGNGLENPDVDLGPMTTPEGIEKTKEHIRDAVSKGARVLYGGKKPEGAQFAKGLFFEPTVLVDVTHEMQVMREETFGPVAPIMVVKDLDQAIEFANDNPYGLVAYLFTNNLKHAFVASERLQFGTVGVNNVAGGETPYPYGGWKQSGFGVENSQHVLNEYLALKHIRMDLPA